MRNVINAKPFQLSASVAGLLLVLTCLQPATGEPTLRDGDSVAIIGDSITQARKYSALMETYFLACKPASSVETMVHGWSGEQAVKLAPRLANDVLRFEPTVATTSYGMNDGRYTAFNETYAATFRDALRGCVQQLKEAGTRVVVIGSPGCVDPGVFNRTQPPSIYNDTLRHFGRIAQTIAEEEGVLFADVHTPMLDAMRQAKARFGDDYRFVGNDGFHPQWAGHFVMAYAYLKTLVGDHEVGRIMLDFKTGDTQTTAGHAVVVSAAGEVELESTRYPFCFFGNDRDPDGTRSAADYTAFNDELNRFMLVVNNAPARSRVTWGTQSKDFTAEELAAGVNLAAEFLGDNPFQSAFMDLLTAVRSKQTYEIHMIKAYITTLPILRDRLLPDDPGLVERITEGILAERRKRLDGIGQLLVPVRYQIKVAAVDGDSADE